MVEAINPPGAPYSWAINPATPPYYEAVAIQHGYLRVEANRTALVMEASSCTCLFQQAMLLLDYSTL